MSMTNDAQSRRGHGIFIALIIAVLIALGVVIYPTLRPAASGTNDGDERNIADVGRAMLQYAEDNGGFLPPSGASRAGGVPRWVTAMEQWRNQHQERQLRFMLKSPRDKSTNATSYELNPMIAGKNISHINSDKPAVILVYEREYAGSRGWTYYLNGWIMRKPDPCTNQKRK